MQLRCFFEPHVMATGRYPYFSRSGWLPFLVVALAGLLISDAAGWLWSLPLWLLCLFILFIYRDPYRDIPSSPLAVVSPADGVVTQVEKVRDPYLDRDAIRVLIAMSHIGVYSTRSPVEGKVMEPPHDGGADHPHGVWLKTDEDDDLIIVMHRGLLHNLPRCYVGIGERVGQGQRCGYIPMGGQVEIYLPCNSRMKVKAGSHVRAGSDVIAFLVHK
ncbi:Phosphatidylserine decarboxylase [hydrothermal vent metagenome]|uniref:Phosphatidylserine decarboxylase n=1 Tax=hydrothermal vent metagenome TaxID=652676 RepID=A0A3B0YED8_9ZZZZ